MDLRYVLVIKITQTNNLIIKVAVPRQHQYQRGSQGTQDEECRLM